MLAILSGALCIVAGLAKLGFITELISKPIRYGYINGIAFIVIAAADMLADLDQKLHQADMDICFAEMKGPVKDVLKRYGLFDSLGTENFFPTIGQAVDRYLELHKVSWRDWDEPV